MARQKMIAWGNRLGYTMDGGIGKQWDLMKPEFTQDGKWHVVLLEKDEHSICGYGKALKKGSGSTWHEAMLNAQPIE